VLAADLPAAAIERLALAPETRLAARAGMTTGPTVVVVRLGVDTLIPAVGLVILALTLPIDAGMTLGTGMAAPATVVRIGVEIDALIGTTGAVVPEATAVVLALLAERFGR
jgi:hypothetical protein